MHDTVNIFIACLEPSESGKRLSDGLGSISRGLPHYHISLGRAHSELSDDIMDKTKNIISISDRARIVEHASSKKMTLSDIAKKFSVSRASVRNLAKKFEAIGSVKVLAKSGLLLPEMLEG